MEELHGSAPAEAVGAQASGVDSHRGEGVGRQGEEDVVFDALPQVGEAVQASVLPLAIDGEAVDRKAGRVQRGGEGLDVGRPGLHLARPVADVPRR